ncbi:MAG: glycerol-3-phosphate acyltransferase [Candidatus Aminicenantia bacterium]
MVCSLSIIIGYLIGSISPACILGKILKGIDIRQHGDKNAGTVNTWRVLGWKAAGVTGLIDVNKGLLSMFIASQLGAGPICSSLAGLSAVVGHVFPFYLKFRGGQGIATAVGMLLYYLFFILKNNWLTLTSLLLLAIVVLSFLYITKKGEMVGLVVLPFLLIFIFLNSPLNRITIFSGIIMAYILSINLLNILKINFLRLKLKSDQYLIRWRLLLRPAAVILVLFYLTQDKKKALILVGGVASFFLVVDLIRLIYKKFNILLFKTKEIFKNKEYREFSSMTLFLTACFLTFLLFEKNIAAMAVTFLIFGDFFSKYFGLRYGRVKIFDKSLEGSLAFFNACLIAGYILLHYIELPTFIFLSGALGAAIVEVLPFGIDDNFSVSLFSASLMYLLQTIF